MRALDVRQYRRVGGAAEKPARAVAPKLRDSEQDRLNEKRPPQFPGAVLLRQVGRPRRHLAGERSPAGEKRINREPRAATVPYAPIFFYATLRRRLRSAPKPARAVPN